MLYFTTRLFYSMSIFARTSDAQDNQLSNLIGLFHMHYYNELYFNLFVGGIMYYCVLYMFVYSDVLSYVFTI